MSLCIALTPKLSAVQYPQTQAAPSTKAQESHPYDHTGPAAFVALQTDQRGPVPCHTRGLLVRTLM
jgi:hypothetical protein